VISCRSCWKWLDPAGTDRGTIPEASSVREGAREESLYLAHSIEPGFPIQTTGGHFHLEAVEVNSHGTPAWQEDADRIAAALWEEVRVVPRTRTYWEKLEASTGVQSLLRKRKSPSPSPSPLPPPRASPRLHSPGPRLHSPKADVSVAYRVEPPGDEWREGDRGTNSATREEDPDRTEGRSGVTTPDPPSISESDLQLVTASRHTVPLCAHGGQELPDEELITDFTASRASD
jgi:hypothetical protein